ncbi:4-hydroxy-tetrahydrodipicolinate synthase [Candidatus Endoriftia persephone]|jgi:4-hydroxy-tetrahydrodipicolinate synthase|uniref:4-hydroxy-tetrahydrodipicolinate synthase n=3 Tax=Gammaproteobacteria TaxID=1236 RepID=G2FHU2_9GAMM|nr:4-hydroxy-tetrahydrodipicolinate synthase [Candidatus Endoriftia persephone]EGW53621.1 dihydrodipicolinate synthase [endosymbiont of Tevnia jerichonana (vent Tica)]USF88377.1 4-hydroxy-tetrahydrodipicolinate synthase [Candidatus Endoriftia persephone]
MFRGSMVALITPMNEDGSVNEESLQHLIEFHIEQGTDAIVAVGTTGESATLDESEHCALIRQVVEQVAGRIPVIAGTGANSTREAISLTRCAKQAGADACLLVTPYYNKPTQEGLYLHHKAVAEAVEIPQILYNVPGRTACDMLPETIARLAELPNIVGVKEATGDLGRLSRIRELCGEGFDVYSGDDATGCEFMLQGGNGVISVTTNVAPRQMSQMCKAALAGDRDAAEQLDRQLAGLHQALFVESNPIPVKWAMHHLGLAPEGIRLPLTWLSEGQQPALLAAMQQAGVC